MKTEIFEANSPSDAVDFNKLNYLEPKDIADAVHYVLSTPPNVQVGSFIVFPSKNPFICFKSLLKNHILEIQISFLQC